MLAIVAWMHDSAGEDVFEELAQRVIGRLIYLEHGQLLNQVARRLVYLYVQLLLGLIFRFDRLRIIGLLHVRRRILPQLHRAGDHRQRNHLVD